MSRDDLGRRVPDKDRGLMGVDAPRLREDIHAPGIGEPIAEANATQSAPLDCELHLGVTGESAV